MNKPEFKTEVVSVSYWSCGNPDHRHRTEDIAARCIARHRPATSRPPPRQWSWEEKDQILAEYRAGSTLREIGRRLGVSVERVRQMKDAAARRAVRASNDPLDALRVRTRNVLAAEGLCTVSDIRAALADGRLEKVPNFGAVGMQEVRGWLDRLAWMPVTPR